MANITTTLTTTELKGLEYVAVNPSDLVEAFAKERARLAIEEIVNLTVQHCLDAGVQVPATRDEIITYAFDNKVVKTAAVREQEFEARMSEA